jgi:hypothetical protein
VSIIRTVHELLGHKDVETTIPQGGTHVLNRGGQASGLRPTAVAVYAGQPEQELDGRKSMDSLVLRMQQQAMDSSVAVTDLVRTALVVATKLEVQEFREWCELELRGYRDRNVPGYRRVVGELKAWNPVLGGFIPVRFRDAGVARALATRAAVQPLGELERVYRDTGPDGSVQMPLTPDVLNQVFANSPGYQMGMVPTVMLARTQVFGILDAVRNTVLEWSLRLEKDGILGEGMTFSSDEKQKAGQITYNIQNFTGVLGTVTAESLQIGDYVAVHSELKRCGVSQDQRNELEEILDQLPNASPEKRTSLLKRGGQWLKRNAGTIGALSDVFRGWFEAFK